MAKNFNVIHKNHEIFDHGGICRLFVVASYKQSDFSSFSLYPLIIVLNWLKTFKCPGLSMIQPTMVCLNYVVALIQVRIFLIAMYMPTFYS